jgi:hypothetical protein
LRISEFGVYGFYNFYNFNGLLLTAYHLTI